MQKDIIFADDCLVLLLGKDKHINKDFIKDRFSLSSCIDFYFFDNLGVSLLDIETKDRVVETIGKRLRDGVITVIDISFLQEEVIRCLLELAKVYKRFLEIVVFSSGIEASFFEDIKILESSQDAQNVKVKEDFKLSKMYLKVISFQKELDYLEDMSRVTIFAKGSREKKFYIESTSSYTPANKYLSDSGPFDIIGDVHGCLDTLLELIGCLGYNFVDVAGVKKLEHKEGRRLVFVGDLADRGPNSIGVLQLVCNLCEQGIAYCVLGNHDDKLRRKLQGHNVKIRHGLETTLKELEKIDRRQKDKILSFLSSLSLYLRLCQGKLVVVHAGILYKDIGSMSSRIRRFCLYGDITGKYGVNGFPIRGDWSLLHRSDIVIVYGHTTVKKPCWQNNTVNIDTGCVFGDKLTALCFPERKFVSVKASKSYVDK